MKLDFSKMTKDEIHTYCRTKAINRVKNKINKQYILKEMLKNAN
jgi:hypothetical protein